MQLLLTIQKRRWTQTFGGNRTRLKLVGLSSLDASKMGDLKMVARGTKLDKVTQLDISSAPSSPRKQLLVKNSVGKALSLILPNLRQVDISHVRITQTAAEAVCQEELSTVGNLSMEWFQRRPLFMKELDHVPQNKADVSIFFACSSKLERVSLRRTKWFHFWLDCGQRGPQPAYPLQQEGLMKFVRRTPTLKWFRSDLSSENSAILQKERPRVTFCN
jgi:hypothetical protein